MGFPAGSIGEDDRNVMIEELGLNHFALRAEDSDDIVRVELTTKEVVAFIAQCRKVIGLDPDGNPPEGPYIPNPVKTKNRKLQME